MLSQTVAPGKKWCGAFKNTLRLNEMYFIHSSWFKDEPPDLKKEPTMTQDIAYRTALVIVVAYVFALFGNIATTIA